jgi:HK97 family phage prohead protease
MIRKVLSFEVKEVSPRVLEFTGSTEDKDRVGDIVMASGWLLKNYKKNPVFLWAHQYDTPPVGKAVKVWIDNDRLKFHVEFPDKDTYEFADTIYKLYKGGYLRATSVGFMPIESEPIEIKDEDTAFHTPTRYLKQDLLELSGCPVPANPNALAEAKTKGLISEDLLTEIAEAEIEDLTEKPYPNEHACRLKNPDDFQDGTFRRMKREHEGKEYSVILGRLKGEDTMTEQAYRYDKKVWSAKEAGAHCKSHDGSFEAASEESLCPISQEEIGDEIDFLTLIFKENELNEKNIQAAWVLVEELIRLSGNIPANIADKVGAKIEQPEAMTSEDISKIIQDSIEAVVNQAKGKI